MRSADRHEHGELLSNRRRLTANYPMTDLSFLSPGERVGQVCQRLLRIGDENAASADDRAIR
jgi:hypothetical protein